MRRCALDSQGCLLAFYDAAEDKVYQRNQIFQVENADSLIIRRNLLSRRLITERIFSDRFALFAIDAEQKASVLSGLVPLKGASEILSVHKSNTSSVLCMLAYHYHTVYEQINFVHLSGIQLNEECNATHLIVGIKWGVNVAVSIEHANSNNEDKEAIEATIRQIVTIMTNNEHLSEQEAQFCGQLLVHLFHDIEPCGKTQMNLPDAFNYLRNITQIELANNQGVPLEYTLIPLGNTRNNRIPESTLVKIPQCFDEIYRKWLLFLEEAKKLLIFFENLYPVDYERRYNYRLVKENSENMVRKIVEIRQNFAYYLHGARTGKIKPTKLIESLIINRKNARCELNGILREFNCIKKWHMIENDANKALAKIDITLANHLLIFCDSEMLI